MIVQDAMNKAFKKKAGKTTIYSRQPFDNYWSNSESRAPHAFHSVILAKGLKEELLFEDVDAARIKRKAEKDQEGENNATLSGILNSLDGITAREGSVVFMTTSHIRRLAPALIRPGRCDQKLFFDYADEHQIRGMCLKFLFSRSASGQLTKDRFPKGETSLDEVDPEDQVRMDAYNAHVHEVAEQICQKITHMGAVTTAQLQAFFMLRRGSPDTIVDVIPDFLE
ncbi:hypothetical protein BGW39_008824 [Mortierella sp. 14UC]|nr:hypothetical protein BGW39_008824 [Mortierella sp. 14UC]